MAAVLERLCQLGGARLIEEHPGGEARFRNPRLALWMSLKGDIVGEPHLDRYPYLLLEADVEALKVQVDEGDMRRGAGSNSTGSSRDLGDGRPYAPAGNRRAVGRRPTGRPVILAETNIGRFCRCTNALRVFMVSCLASVRTLGLVAVQTACRRILARFSPKVTVHGEPATGLRGPKRQVEGY
jgi:hypothetical protein